MAGSSWSSSSSSRTLSFGSLDDDVVCVVKPPDAAVAAEGSSVKFLCSYGGRILPRHTDGALRYVGGDNRVLSVDRSLLQFYELQRKLGEMCGSREVTLRCQLPTEDLDALVSVTSDDDLANLLDEYGAAGPDRRLQPLKIRAFLFPRTPPPPKQTSPPSTPPSMLSSRQPPNVVGHLRRQNGPSPGAAAAARASQSSSCAPRWWAAAQIARPARAVTAYQPTHAPRPHRRLVHNGSHWQ